MVQLNPFSDQKTVLRARRRLEIASCMKEDARFPTILDAKNAITKLYIEHAHHISIHQGSEFVKSFIQQRYYINGVQLALCSERFKCFICRRFDAQNLQPKMAPLPSSRFPQENTHYPFISTGVDFFAPFFIQNRKKTKKHYAIIFNCLTTRAAHLESCPDLKADNALARFTARRGSPKTIYSDNGKTFVGAGNELKKCLKEQDKNKIETKLAVNEIEWKFNPPYGTHFGGAWERLIQIAKRTILIILGSKKLTLGFFNTILRETETMLNSRPLTNVADNTDNEEPLTPNHFLIERPFSNLPPGIFDDRIPLRFENWFQQQQLLNHIWRRLRKEYLPTLLKRTKWNFAEELLKRGVVVWILRDRTPRGIWPLGRVTAEHPGRDGTTRVVTVRTAYG